MRARELGRTPIVVGDDVGLVGDLSGRTDTLARIVRRGDRRTVLRRTADDTDPTERVVVANADQLLIVVALADPPPRTGLVERALIAAYAGGLTPILCLTKSDLAPAEPFAAQFVDLDLTIATAGRDDPLDVVAPLLTDKMTVLLGHSGVGKSTLVNRLVPEADRAIGDVTAVGKGQAHVDAVSGAAACRAPAGSSIRPASVRSGSPTSSRTTCCWPSPIWPRRSRTAHAAAVISVRPPTRSARWTRCPGPQQAGSRRRDACWPRCEKAESSRNCGEIVNRAEIAICQQVRKGCTDDKTLPISGRAFGVECQLPFRPMMCQMPWWLCQPGFCEGAGSALTLGE